MPMTASATRCRAICSTHSTICAPQAELKVLGADFVTLYMDVKLTEHEAYQQVISAWEREHLLLNV